MKQPFFSIVIPTKDRPECVKIILESIKQQKYTDYEVIVSDNASERNCKEAVEEMKDSRFMYYRNENTLGICDSFEAAIEHANGQWVMMFGDKNILYPDGLEKLCRCLEKKNPEILNFGHDFLGPINPDRSLVYGTLKKLKRSGCYYRINTEKALESHFSCRHLLASTKQQWYLGCIFSGGGIQSRFHRKNSDIA